MSFRQLIALAALGLACGAPPAPDSRPPERAPALPPTSAPAPADACAGLDEMQCITSDDCTLILVAEERGYLCRPAEGPCERGFQQRDGSAESCEAKAGCHFVPGHCYCSPDVTCICGGGPPPQCVEGEIS